MSSTPQPSIPQSTQSASLSRPGSAARRSNRQPRATEGKDSLSQAASTSSASSTRAASQSMTDTAPPTHPDEPNTADKQTDPLNPTPWKHPDELPYIRREDWSQDLMLEYLCQKSFTIPPRDGASNPFMEIIPRDGTPVSIPRKYRVALMFLAKFQWESLRLVLNAANPATEWEEFRFDIIHITRLCQHLFHQAREAKQKGGAKGLDRMWRSPMFDRVLTRFYHHWFISREWSLKHFYEEFEEEEYENDILRNDWTRWALKGHKGFRLSKEEIQNGITAEDFMRGLGRNADGVWIWGSEPATTEGAIPAPVLSTEPISPPPSEDLESITNVTPANNTIEVKREHLESAGNNFAEQQVERNSTLIPSQTSPANEEPVQNVANPAQLAGTKRPREEEDPPALPSPQRRRNYTARRSMAEAYRYGQLANSKLQSPQKSAETPSVSDTSPKEPAEGKSPEKLSIKLKRTTPSVVLPVKKKEPLAGPADSSSSTPTVSHTSVSAPVRRPLKRRRPKKVAADLPSNARIIPPSLTPSGPSENATNVSATKLSEPSKPSPVVPGLPFVSSNHTSGLPFNKSPAAILIPTNPKQHMSYVPPGPDSSSNAKMDMAIDSAVSPGILNTVPARRTMTPSAPPASPAETHKDTNSIPSNATSIANGVLSSTISNPRSPISPPESTPQPSLPRTMNQVNATEKPMMFVNASESIIAHGLLEVSVPSSIARDTAQSEPVGTRNDEVITAKLASLPSLTISELVAEKPLPKGPSPVAHDTPSSSSHTGANDAPLNKENTQINGPDSAPATSGGQHTLPRSDTPQASLQSETVSNSVPVFPMPETISALIPKPSPDARTSSNAAGSDPKDDRMVVDNDVDHINHPSTSSRDRSLSSEHSVGLLMAQDTRAKSLHTILLLRDLLEFLRLQSPSTTPAQVYPEQGIRTILDPRTRRMILNEEEDISVDQRLDVLAHASVALAKVLYPYRGVELERRMVSLDKRLQQQFDMVWSPEEQLSAAMQLQARISSDKGIQTSTLSISRGVQSVEEPDTTPETPSPAVETTSQGVQTSEELRSREVAAIGIQTDDMQVPVLQPAERRASPLSSDVTMVDLSQNAPMDSIASEIPKPSTSSEAQRRSEPVAKIMIAIMRNMSDILECSTRDDESFSGSVKGKEREGDADDLRLRPSDRYSDSPIVSTIINEFKNMKEELRHTEQWSREEFRSLSLHHRTEVDSLKSEIAKGKEELEEMKRRHQAEIDRLNSSLTSAAKGKGKEENVDDEMKTPVAELRDLRRRISSLESRSRLGVLNGDAASAASRGSPVPAPPPELPAVRPSQWQAHPLGHLMAHDYHSAPSLSPQPLNTFARETSTKPGTPLSADRTTFYTRSTDGMETEETPPLPAKSQRKLHMMMFPRTPLG